MNYKEFFAISGGGVTFSGGEPLMQGEFVASVAQKIKGIHKAIQTSGYAPFEVYQKVISGMDYIMQDIKIADSRLHKEYTGVGNEGILKNIEYLKSSGKDFVFRVPLIPDITDTEENLRQISEIVGEHPVELLKYNVLAGAKYPSVGKKYSLADQPNEPRDYEKYFIRATVR